MVFRSVSKATIEPREKFLYELKAPLDCPLRSSLDACSEDDDRLTSSRPKGAGHVGGDGNQEALAILQEAIYEEPPEAPRPDCGPEAGGAGER